MLEIFACAGVGVTSIWLLRDSWKKKKADETELTEAMHAMKLNYKDWVKVGDGYEYHYRQIRCRIEQLPHLSSLKRAYPMPFGFRLTVWKKGVYIVSGHHDGEKRPRFLYNDVIGTFKVKAIRHELESENFYQLVRMRYRQWEQASKRPEAIEEKGNVERRISSKRQKLEYLYYIRQIDQLPHVMPKGRSRHVLYGLNGVCVYLDVVSEGKHWTYTITFSHLVDIKTKRQIADAIDRKKNHQPLRYDKPSGDVQKKEPSGNWNVWQRAFDKQVARLNHERKWLTDEEIHLVTETYPHDLDELKKLYDTIDETMQEEMKDSIERTLSHMNNTMERFHTQIANRKKQEMEKRLRIMEARAGETFRHERLHESASFHE